MVAPVSVPQGGVAGGRLFAVGGFPIARVPIPVLSLPLILVFPCFCFASRTVLLTILRLGLLLSVGQVFLSLPGNLHAAEPFPNLSQAHFEHGQHLLNRGNLDEALSAFQSAITLDPENADAHYNAGYVLGRKGDTESAIHAYREAVRLFPDDSRFAEVYVNLAYALEQAGDLDQAIFAWRSALRLNPAQVPARRNLELALRHKQQIDRVVERWEETARLHPDEALIHASLGTALGQSGDVEGEIQAWREAIRLQPDQTMAYVGLGIALGQKEDLTGEIAVYQEAIRRQPDNPDVAPAYFNLAYALGKTGRFEEAGSAWRKAIQLRHGAEVHGRLEWLIGKRDLVDHMISAWEHVIRQHPDDAGAWMRLGLALGQKDDREGELTAYRHAIGLQPSGSILGEAYGYLGDALTRSGAWQEAIEVYQTLVDLRPDDSRANQGLSVAHRQLGLALLKQGDLDRAIQELRLTIQLNPNDEQAKVALTDALDRKEVQQN
ncbi:MAG: tetratricopeptide repeat protein [Nitrospiraceae bacterium]|nr:tetratricopeptide repeat protein [Nitrospiraceae bacterium]